MQSKAMTVDPVDNHSSNSRKQEGKLEVKYREKKELQNWEAIGTLPSRAHGSPLPGSESHIGVQTGRSKISTWVGGIGILRTRPPQIGNRYPGRFYEFPKFPELFPQRCDMYVYRAVGHSVIDAPNGIYDLVPSCQNTQPGFQLRS